MKNQKITFEYAAEAMIRQNQQSECAPSENSDQPVRSMGSQGPKLSSRAQQRLVSDLADAQAYLSLRWAHTHFVGFVMSWLMCLWWLV